MPRYALRLAYDGTAFHGWWRQRDRRSVAGELDAAFTRLGEIAAQPVGAARTDAGVQALGQVAHVDLAREWDPVRLLQSLDAQLPADCTCTAVAAVANDWHAVHAATGKTYRYVIDDGAVADPFRHRHAWRPPFRLDIAALNAAARKIPGERDWRGFVRRGDQRTDLVRTINSVQWTRDGAMLTCTVRGVGFTYRLVRSLVGAMVAVAQGTCSATQLSEALAGSPSPAGQQQAPAHGLWLVAVHYDLEPAWRTP